MKKGFFVLLAVICSYAGMAQRTTTSTTTTGPSVLRDARNGKSYKTITVGGTIWMAENLAFQMGAGNSFNPDGNASNLAEYGFVYRNGLNQPEACPEGWRLPTKAEFEALLTSAAGAALLPTNTRTAPGSTTAKTSVDLLKDLGFDIKFAGMNAPGEQGGFFNDEFGTHCMFWTSTSVSGFQFPHKYAARIDKATGTLVYTPFRLDHAFSIRCVKK